MNFIDWIRKKTTFFGWKIFLTVSSFIVAVLAMFALAYPEAPDWFEFWFVTSSGVFSAMVLVWFIDEISKHLQEKADKRREAKKIRQFNKILQLYIDRYFVFFYYLTTPIAERKSSSTHTESNKTKKTISFKDMRDMFLPTGCFSEGFLDSSIECFVRAESALKEEVEIMVKNIDYTYYPEIQEHLLDFVKASLEFNRKRNWLSAKLLSGSKKCNGKVVNCKLSDQIAEILASGEADDWFNNETPRSNDLLYPYLALRQMILLELEALAKYRQEMEKINIEVTDTK